MDIDDRTQRNARIRKPGSNQATQAMIDSAAAYWKEKSTLPDGHAIGSLPGGFFWNELIDAVLAART